MQYVLVFTNSVFVIQVHRAFFWVEYALGWDNILVYATVETYKKRGVGHLYRHFGSFGFKFPDVMVEKCGECLEIVYDAVRMRESEGHCILLTPLYSYIRPSDRILHILC